MLEKFVDHEVADPSENDACCDGQIHHRVSHIACEVAREEAESRIIKGRDGVKQAEEEGLAYWAFNRKSQGQNESRDPLDHGRNQENPFEEADHPFLR